MEWRPDASKMIVLIADAPPHGIGEYGDGECGVTMTVVWVVYSSTNLSLSVLQASMTALQMVDMYFPLIYKRDTETTSSFPGLDPLEIAREMASRGITLVGGTYHTQCRHRG